MRNLDLSSRLSRGFIVIKWKIRKLIGKIGLEEKMFLFELCRNSVDVIENKRITLSANSIKNEVEEILCNFQSRFGEKRNLKQIKELWKRIKLQAKKEYRIYNDDIRKTGGGPPPKDLSYFTQNLLNIIPGEFTQHYNMYDGDSEAIERPIQNENVSICNPANQPVQIIQINDDDGDNSLQRQEVQDEILQNSTSIQSFQAPNHKKKRRLMSAFEEKMYKLEEENWLIQK